MGTNALQVNTTGSNNTGFGYSTLKANTTGDWNVGVGYGAGDALTTGSQNVFVGRYAGAYSVTTTTGSLNVCIGPLVHTSSVSTDCAIGLGYSVTAPGDSLTFGCGATDSRIGFGATSITAPSDERLKEEITTATAGLSFVNDLRPVTFKWKKEKDIPADLDGYKEGSEKRFKTDTTEHGFIAQEVKTAIDAHNEIKDGFDMWSEDSSGGRQRLGDSSLIPMLVKAIQELSAKVTALENA
jgi:hypothetical protein